MFIKKRIVICLTLVFLFEIGLCRASHAVSLIKLPTQAQLEKLCVPVRLSTDGDIHWFYYKHIKQFDEHGLSVVYGKRLTKVNFISVDQILNFKEAVKRFEEIKKANE